MKSEEDIRKELKDLESDKERIINKKGFPTTIDQLSMEIRTLKWVLEE